MPCGIESLFTEELWLQSYGCSVYKSNEKGHNVIQLGFFFFKKKGWFISSENQNSSLAKDSDVQF